MKPSTLHALECLYTSYRQSPFVWETLPKPIRQWIGILNRAGCVKRESQTLEGQRQYSVTTNGRQILTRHMRCRDEQ